MSRSDNQKNKSRGRNNKSGVTGVSWHKMAGKWQATVRNHSVQRALGVYDDWFEAVCARKSAEVRFGFHVNHGRG